MAIESGRLTFKSGSYTRQQAKKTALVISSVVPGTQGRRIEDGVAVDYIETPDWEGRMVVYHPVGDTRAFLYVAVDVGGGVLEWKQADSGVIYINSNTGEEWTGIEGFLTPWVPYPSS